MTIREIHDRPTDVTEIPMGCRGVHESMLRAWHVVRKVEDLLRRGTPADVVLELIAEMEEINHV